MGVGVGAVAVAVVGLPVVVTGAPGQPPPPPSPLPEFDLYRVVDSPTWLGLPPEPPWHALARRVADQVDESPPQLIGWVQQIWSEASRYGRDPYFDASLVLLESDFNPHSTSPAGALGLYQLMPDTAADVADALHLGPLTPERLYDPAVNIRLGAYYLDQLEHKYTNWTEVLTAYNMGEGGLQSHVRAYGTPVSAYSRRVLELWQELRSGTASAGGRPLVH